MTTRRGFLGGAAAGAAASATPAIAARKSVRRADVVVIGAGFAGLAAARAVAARGRSVIVLEARRRVGGRVHNHRFPDGTVAEIGGQWVGPTQDKLLKLARDLKVDTFETYNEGNNVYFRDGRLTPYASTGPLGPIPPDPTGAPEAFVAIQQINAMAAEVPREAPWTAARAEEYDGQTFETYKRDNAQTEGGRFLLDLGIEAVFAAEPRDISLLHVLFYVNSAGNEDTPGTFDRLINTAGGAQESRFVGGSQVVAQRMARALGKRVVLGAPVRAIEQSGGRVRAISDRLTVSARHAIVAVPPAVGAQIRYDPILPGPRAQLLQRFPMGSVIKCMAVYPEPFWRAEGLTGQATSDTGPVKITFDNSPPDGSPGIMMGFIEGQEAREWTRRPAAERRAAVLGSFVRYFGERAAKPTAYVDRSWAEEEWTRGCYGGYLPPGVLLDYGADIRRPHGRVHWAGTETSPIWNGYIEGALRSGERAASEAIAG